MSTIFEKECDGTEKGFKFGPGCYNSLFKHTIIDKNNAVFAKVV
jgi:hypothetical protein